MSYANIVPTPGIDGVAYCTNVPITSTEADLGDGLYTDHPVAVEYGQVIVGTIQLTINGFITGNSTYVVLQTDMGDGVWIDALWVFNNIVQGTALYSFGAGGVASLNTTPVQQTRQAGTVPLAIGGVQGTGSKSLVLLGRIRFVGQTVMTSGSSSAPGVTTQMLCTIKYKLQAPR